MKIEAYESSQLPMESFAAENRRFKCTLAMKMANFGQNLALFWSDRCRSGRHLAGAAPAGTKTKPNLQNVG